MSAFVASALLSTPVLRDAINGPGILKAGPDTILSMFADGVEVDEMAGYAGSFGVCWRRESHCTTPSHPP